MRPIGPSGPKYMVLSYDLAEALRAQCFGKRTRNELVEKRAHRMALP
jgi:hypothetical protein